MIEPRMQQTTGSGLHNAHANDVVACVVTFVYQEVAHTDVQRNDGHGGSFDAIALDCAVPVLDLQMRTRVDVCQCLFSQMYRSV